MSNAYEQAKATVRNMSMPMRRMYWFFCGSGMTAAVNKLQRIMGLRLPERIMDYVKCIQFDESARPLVLITHMEHHSKSHQLVGNHSYG